MAKVPQTLTKRITEQVERIKLPESFTLETAALMAEDVALLHDLMDDIIKSVDENQDPQKRDVLTQILGPFELQVRCSTDIILAVLDEVTLNNLSRTEELRDICTNAIRAVFLALEDFIDAVEARLLPPEEIRPQAVTIIDVTRVCGD